MRDSLNHIQGNDLGAGWIDHHTDLLLLFALLYGMVNLSDFPIVERWRSKPCLNLRMVWHFFPYTRQLLPIVGHTVRMKPDPFPAGETINWWPPWYIDSCLVLAPYPSAMKTQSQKNLTKMKGQKYWGKGYAPTGRAQRRNFPENLRRLAPSRIRMEYMSIDGTVTMFLRVVAPQTPVMIDGIWGDPQTLTFSC